MEKIQEEYDVIVVGGGTTGVCAAIAAARGGARTALIEYYGFLGGNAACGLPWLSFHNQDQQLVVKGIPLEIINRLKKVDGATDFHFDPICNSAVGVNSGWLKVILGQMVVEDGIDTYLHSLAGDIETKGDNMTGVYIYNKQGCQLLESKVVIDCTDSGDIAVKAGADYEFGRKKDGKVQVASYVMTVGNIVFDEMLNYFSINLDQIRPFDKGEDKEGMRKLLRKMKNSSVFILGAFPELVTKASQEGINIPRDRIVGAAYPERGELVLVTSRVEQVNPNDIKNFSKSELKGLSQVSEILKFIREYMPGGKYARLVNSGHQIGIRESRHIYGDYYLTGEDLISGKEFNDVIALGAYHLDIHSPDHKGLETNQPPTYGIPYRCLLPRGIEGLLIAGRGISASHEAMSSTRVIPISAAQGQAAGTAAALAVKNKIMPRQVAIKELQNILIKNGAKINI